MLYKNMKKIITIYIVTIGISVISLMLSFAWIIYNLSDFKTGIDGSPFNQFVGSVFALSLYSFPTLIGIGVISLVVGFVGHSLRKMKDK